MVRFEGEREAIIKAMEAYQFLINKYKTPLDIPENAWMQGKDMEIGKWYLWVNEGRRYQTSNKVSSEQHIIMIPKLFNNKVQTVKNFDALWYLHGPNFSLFQADLDDDDSTYLKKNEMEWYSKADLDIELDDFGLMHKWNFVVGPLEYGEREFLNWGLKNPWEVKE